MIDREKVIDAFDEAKELVWTDDDEYTVGYNNGLEVGKDIALALLKEQEAVSAVQREVLHLLVWCCGSCGVPITSGDKFCRNCGKVMKWNAID